MGKEKGEGNACLEVERLSFLSFEGKGKESPQALTASLTLYYSGSFLFFSSSARVVESKEEEGPLMGREERHEALLSFLFPGTSLHYVPALSLKERGTHASYQRVFEGKVAPSIGAHRPFPPLSQRH